MEQNGFLVNDYIVTCQIQSFDNMKYFPAKCISLQLYFACFQTILPTQYFVVIFKIQQVCLRVQYEYVCFIVSFLI